MKKGKTCKINGFRTFKSQYGTIDSQILKSIYLNIQTWVEPHKDSDNWNRVVLNLSRSIKHTVLRSINQKLFKENFIVDLDLRPSGINLNKKSFLNLEVNLFTNIESLDFKDNSLKESLKELTKNIINSNFSKNDYFNFSITKKTKSPNV